jgi:SsrA-binding protein
MIIATNKRAKFDYTILETYQAGLSLSGTMVKLVRANKVNIQGKFIVYQKDRLEILGMGNEKMIENIPLLLSKKEINKISGQIAEKGISCIILNLKIVGRWLKADIATVKGKKEYDKRETIKKRDMDRDDMRGDL